MRSTALVRAFFIACLGTSTYVGIRLLRLWTMTSYNQMEKAEMDLLKVHRMGELTIPLLT
jgi:hypothetical protein